MPIRVLIADDHPVFMLGLRTLLHAEPGDEFLVVGQLGDGESLPEAVAAFDADVLLLSSSLCGSKLADELRRVTAAGPPVLLLASSAGGEPIMELMASGVVAYVLRDEPPDMVRQAVRAASAGETWLSPRVAARALRVLQLGDSTPESVELPLTPRENHILRLVAQGKSNSDIADELVLSKATVQNHISSIYAKLHLQSRSQAVIYALRHNLVSVDEIVG